MGEAFIRRRKGCICNTIGHNEVYWITSEEPTCEEEGVMLGVCQRCEKAIYVNGIEPLGHDNYSPFVDQDATCTEPAYAIQYCSRCGTEINREYVSDPLGHEWYDTGDVGSLTRYRCSRCLETSGFAPVEPTKD